MKIIAVSGSTRKGNTLRMVQAACSVFPKETYQLLDLSELPIHFCDGCLSCDETHTCHIDDDLTKKLQDIANADAYIFASPVRWSLLSGEMKTFFDRLNPFAAIEGLVGKKSILMVVGQSELDGMEAYSIDKGLSSMIAFCENAGIEVVSTIKAFGCLEPNDIEGSDYLQDCKKAAVKLWDSINQQT